MSTAPPATTLPSTETTCMPPNARTEDSRSGNGHVRPRQVMATTTAIETSAPPAKAKTPTMPGIPKRWTCSPPEDQMTSGNPYISAFDATARPSAFEVFMGTRSMPSPFLSIHLRHAGHMPARSILICVAAHVSHDVTLSRPLTCTISARGRTRLASGHLLLLAPLAASVEFDEVGETQEVLTQPGLRVFTADTGRAAPPTDSAASQA